MTERKSTEIKIRVTPSFKARVQSAADAAGVSLTEWLENASEEKMVALLAPITARKGWEFISTDSTLTQVAATMTANVFERNLEAQLYSQRRTEPCPHSKPPYAFCAECDR